MPDFFSNNDTRVRRCRHHFTAWFGEAEPKILWRAAKAEAEGTFWLRRHGNGWTEIVKRDAAGAETMLASFSGGDQAEEALAKLKRAFMGARFGFWRIVLWLLAAFGVFMIVLTLYNYRLYREQVTGLAAYQAGMQTNPQPQAPAGMLPPVMQPQSVQPSGPIPGRPMDADSVLH